MSNSTYRADVVLDNHDIAKEERREVLENNEEPTRKSKAPFSIPSHAQLPAIHARVV